MSLPASKVLGPCALVRTALRPAGASKVSAVWLFPGQGSQHVGMAAAWADRSPVARDALREAADVLGFDLPGLMRAGPADVLNDTYNAQPALLAASVAILRAAGDRLPRPAFVAGHSMGEYSALVAAGALSFSDGLHLVRERGRLMRLAGERRPGGMAAVLGLDDAVVEAVCGDIPGVQVANYNAPGQVVISGETGAVADAVTALESRGAKRIAVLPITIAAHSELMESVADEFAAVVEAAPIGRADPPVVANVTARAISEPDELRAELASQLTASVRWSDGVRLMSDAGVDRFFEVGPGKVLCGLVRRTLRSADRTIQDLEALSEPGG